MSREPEKFLKELQRLLDYHADEIKSEVDTYGLPEQFLAEYDQ